MNLLRFIKREARAGGTPFVLGGLASVFALSIVMTFGLAVLDRYALSISNLAAVISSALVDLTNGDRIAHNLGGLAVNPTLVKAAQAKANDMAAKSYFAHVSPEGLNSWHWFKQAGYAFTYAGENLAVDFSDSVDVERAWMNSPSHRANILNGKYTEIGIATAVGFFEGRPTTFVVQMFASPAAPVMGAQAKTTVASLEVETVALPEDPTEPAFATIEPVTVAGASVEPAPEVSLPSTGEANVLEHAVASPKTTLKYTYYALAVLILLALAYVTRFELKRHHVHHFAGATLLIVLMFGLFTFASIALFTEPTLAAAF